VKNALDFARHPRVKSDITFKRLVELSNSIERCSKPLIELDLIFVRNLHLLDWLIVIELKAFSKCSNLRGNSCPSTFEFVKLRVGKGEVLK
jgi:hypothetical protein